MFGEQEGDAGGANNGAKAKRAPKGSGYLTRLDRLEECVYGRFVEGSCVKARLDQIEADMEIGVE